jgi:parallel beta-helix repeat protein
MIFQPETLVHNRYVIKRLLANSDMSVLYQAADQREKCIVALKQSLAHDEHFRKAFARESRLLARLKHPTLPEVKDFFDNESGQYLVMQFIPGEDLGTLLEREGKRFQTAGALVWILRWADQILDALIYLHSQKPPVIHRDIKPHNLKLTARGEIKLLDFGLAKGSVDQTHFATVHSVRGYTQQYAPLEQIQGVGTDPSSDLYALAATLYHLLTGTPPPDALTRAAARLSDQPDPLKPAREINPLIPADVSAILHQAMELERGHRFASATAMRTALLMTRKNADEGHNSSGQQTIVSAGAGPPSPPIPQPDPVQSQQPEHSFPTLVVSPHEAGAYRRIGEAMARAEPGSRIILHPGTYQEKLVLDKPLEIIGDGPVADIIIETKGTTSIQMKTDYARLRGLTIRARAQPQKPDQARAGEKARESLFFAVDIAQGRLTIEECNLSSETLACVAIHGPASNPIVWRCNIHNSKGVGFFFYNQGRGIIEACNIEGNAKAGIWITQKSSPCIRRCTIHRSKQDGIHIGEKASGTIEECEIFENGQAGITIKQESTPLVRWCKIHHQKRGYGVHVFDGGAGILESCEVFENGEAGFAVTQQGNPLVRQCTIHHEEKQGLLVLDEGRGLFEGCELADNGSAGVVIGQEGNPTLRQCTIRNGEQVGVLVRDNGTGQLEDCTIVENGHAGVEIRQHSNPVIRRCQITRNGMVAIMVHQNGTGIVEESNLTGNHRAAWFVEDGCLVLGDGNRE